MYDIITIGSATRDVFLRSGGIETIRSSRFVTGVGECLPLGSKVNIEELVFAVGGSAANTAVTFARRGMKTAMAARIGKDGNGNDIIAAMRKENVAADFVRRDPRLFSPYSVVLPTKKGERSILAYRGAGAAFSVSDITFSRLRARWFYITHLSDRAAPLFPKLLRHADRIGAKVSVNPGKTQLTMPLNKLKPLLNLIDVFILNREEGSYLTKIPYRDEDRIFQKLDSWVRGLVVMTDGPGGVTVSDGNTRWHAGILKEKRVVDRTGAGDAFGSGFVAALIERSARKNTNQKANQREYAHAMPYAIQVGSANATSVIEKIGAQAGILQKRDSIYKWGRLHIKEQKLL